MRLKASSVSQCCKGTLEDFGTLMKLIHSELSDFVVMIVLMAHCLISIQLKSALASNWPKHKGYCERKRSRLHL
jgi:hypothetical protein